MPPIDQTPHRRPPPTLFRWWIGRIAQGNRVLTKQHFQEVVLTPACLETFALDADFQAGLLLDVNGAEKVGHWGGGMVYHWSEG